MSSMQFGFTRTTTSQGGSSLQISPTNFWHPSWLIDVPLSQTTLDGSSLPGEGWCSLPTTLTVMWLCFLISTCTFGPSPKLALRTPTSLTRREQHFTVKEKRAALHSKNSLLQKKDTTQNAILILTKSLESLSLLRCLGMLCRTSCSRGSQEKAVVSHSHYH